MLHTAKNKDALFKYLFITHTFHCRNAARKKQCSIFVPSLF